MAEPIAESARDIVEDVTKELEQTQPEATPTPEVEAVEPKPEPATEVKVEPEAKVEPQEPETTPEVKPERTERKSKYVPVQKANQWRHEANESKTRIVDLERQLAEAKTSTSEKTEEQQLAELDAIAKEIAGESADPAVVKRILEATKKLIPQQRSEPSEDVQSLLELKKDLESKKEEQGFNSELTQTLTKFPELSGHESDLKEMAYAEGNEKIPLELLAYKLRDELNLSNTPPSAEGVSSTPQSTDTDFGSMSESEINALQGVEFDKYLAWMADGVKKRTGIRL